MRYVLSFLFITALVKKTQHAHGINVFIRKHRAVAQLKLKTQQVQIENLVKSKSGIADFFEEKFDSDDLDKECMGEERCTYEEVLELSKDEEEAQKNWDKLARQCFSEEFKCNAQGSLKCINLWNNRRCICNEGWEGDNCAEDINECERYIEMTNSMERLNKNKPLPDMCPKFSSCVNSHGSFTCDCHIGYEKDRNTRECIDIDECKDPQFCGANMICENKTPMFSCDCKPGFAYPTNSTEYCEDINECLDGKDTVCEFDQLCKNTIGSFTCEKIPECDEGFRRYANYEDVDDEVLAGSGNENFDGFSRMDCVDIDECEEFLHNCTDKEVCRNDFGGFGCEDNPSYRHPCKTGYEHSSLIEGCIDINECLSGGCGKDNCINIPGSFYCEIVTTTSQSLTTTKKTCQKGFMVDFHGDCMDIDECEFDVEDQKCPTGSTCQNTFGDYRCRPDCTQGFTRTGFDVCVDVDECGGCFPMTVDCPCDVDSQCKNNQGSFTCEKIPCNADCDVIHAECITGNCECVKNTLDTSHFVKAKHRTLTEKCLFEVPDQVDWMNWYFKRFGNNPEKGDPRFIVGLDRPCPEGYEAVMQKCGFRKCVQ